MPSCIVTPAVRMQAAKPAKKAAPSAGSNGAASPPFVNGADVTPPTVTDEVASDVAGATAAAKELLGTADTAASPADDGAAPRFWSIVSPVAILDNAPTLEP